VVDILQGEPDGSVREGNETVDDLELLQASAWIYCLLSHRFTSSLHCA
jgi:hypothetical protein